MDTIFFPLNSTILHSLFSFGVKTGYLSANPASMIKTTKAKDALNERILQTEEVKKLIDAVSTKRECAILILLYILGLRRSELVGLNWSDFQPTFDAIASGSARSAIAVTIFGKGHKTRT